MASRKKKPPAQFPIVGIGASAGGLAAFEAFFSGMPPDVEPGMAFVLVQHLDPDHKSMLTDLIRRYTRLQVFEVEDGMTVQPNCIYIIPPNRDMALSHGCLQLLEPSAPRGRRLPIDFFFRSLAQDQHERAIGVVLSGTASDGALGVRAIKGEGGMVMVQSPDSTEYDGMPNSALATGLVDYTLVPAQMAPQLIAYAQRAFTGSRASAPRVPSDENALRKIFVVLRDRLGHDFSQYKPGGVERRVKRRMAVHQVGSLTEYLKYLQQTPVEVDALFGDLLIGVTHFFRDPEAFQVLETTIIPQLLSSKPVGATVRAWSVGCSTGEEAYSIAILFQEHLDSLQQHCQVQVFATDIDSRAIAAARSGLYPVSIAADVSAERLDRFFTLEPDGRSYRVARRIRDLLVFSEQDVIRDPPFSRLDLIVCRNLLIYLGAELQKKLMPIFHYALNPGAVLFLGSSESIGEFEDLFAPVDRKAKLFQRKEDFHAAPRTAMHRFRTPIPADLGPKISRSTVGNLSLRQLTEQALLQKVVPAAALVNSQGDILYMHGRTGLYLEPAPGEAGINNVLKMAREGLRYDLAAALHKAAASLEVVHCPGLRVQGHDQTIPVQLTVHPLQTRRAPELPMFLVLFEQSLAVPAPTVQLSVGAEVECDARVVGLKQELLAKEEFLQSAVEELESSNEELKSSNEEMQSVNEELQSTNEELETSKEELQSVNEELSTVNSELQSKLADFTRLNNDMNNLLAGTGIATIFLDLQLRVLRFTPASTRIVNLILSDLGRPMAHIVPNLVHYDRLTVDAQVVLDTLVPQEIEVNSRDGRSYKLRIQPYRTLDNVIEGVVLSFVDITDMVRLREGLRQANDLLRLAVVVRDAHDAITVQDLNGSTLAWNPAATRVYGWSEAEALLLPVQQRIPQPLRLSESDRMSRLVQGQVLPPYASQRLNKEGQVLEVQITATALIDPAGHVYAVATTERPSTPGEALDGSQK